MVKKIISALAIICWVQNSTLCLMLEFLLLDLDLLNPSFNTSSGRKLTITLIFSKVDHSITNKISNSCYFFIRNNFVSHWSLLSLPLEGIYRNMFYQNNSVSAEHALDSQISWRWGTGLIIYGGKEGLIRVREFLERTGLDGRAKVSAWDK